MRITTIALTTLNNEKIHLNPYQIDSFKPIQRCYCNATEHYTKITINNVIYLVKESMAEINDLIQLMD